MGRVLVIDDEDAIAHLVRLAFRATGVEIDVASRGDEALRLVAERRYPVLVSDLAMPGMTGLELARRLHEGCPEARIVIISAVIDPATEADLEALPNVAAILRKPFDVFELAERVQGLLPAEGMRDEGVRGEGMGNDG